MKCPKCSPPPVWAISSQSVSRPRNESSDVGLRKDDGKDPDLYPSPDKYDAELRSLSDGVNLRSSGAGNIHFGWSLHTFAGASTSPMTPPGSPSPRSSIVLRSEERNRRRAWRSNLGPTLAVSLNSRGGGVNVRPSTRSWVGGGQSVLVRDVDPR